MTLQSSGAISLANIQTEFGGSNPISLSEYYGAASGVPTSGAISLSNFYGKSSVLYESNYAYAEDYGVTTTYRPSYTYVYQAVVPSNGPSNLSTLTLDYSEYTSWFSPKYFSGQYYTNWAVGASIGYISANSFALAIYFHDESRIGTNLQPSVTNNPAAFSTVQFKLQGQSSGAIARTNVYSRTSFTHSTQPGAASQNYPPMVVFQLNYQPMYTESGSFINGEQMRLKLILN